MDKEENDATKNNNNNNKEQTGNSGLRPRDHTPSNNFRFTLPYQTSQ